MRCSCVESGRTDFQSFLPSLWSTSHAFYGSLFLHKSKMKISLVTVPPLLILPAWYLFKFRPVFYPNSLYPLSWKVCPAFQARAGAYGSLIPLIPHRFSDARDRSGLLSRKMQISHPKDDGLDSDLFCYRKGQSWELWISRLLPSSDIC